MCDSPEYFYDYCQGLIDGMAGVGVGEGGEGDGAGAYDARELMRVVDAKGAGYAVATDEELDTVRAVARCAHALVRRRWLAPRLRPRRRLLQHTEC